MADNYAREISRVVVGQLAELAGYEAAQDSAVEVLGELLIKYISELSQSSHGYAEIANRTSANFHDVLWALEDLGTNVPELNQYLSELSPEDNTFAHPLPQFPIQKPGRVLPTFQDKKEQPPAHIPSFLPAFPDKHTYMHTPKFKGHETEPLKQNQILQQDRRQAENALAKLHYNLIQAPTSMQPAAGTEQAQKKPDPGESQATGPSNPYISQPDVEEAVVPAGKLRRVGSAEPSSGAAGLDEEAGRGAKAADAGTAEGDAQPARGSRDAGPVSMEVDEGEAAREVKCAAGAADGSGKWGAVEQGGGQRSRGPGSSVQTFAPVLPRAVIDPGGVQQTEAGLEPDELYAPEEISSLLWKSDQMPYESGIRKTSLASHMDYEAQAFSKSQALAPGQPPKNVMQQSSQAKPMASGPEKRQSRKKSEFDHSDPAKAILDRARQEFETASEDREGREFH